MNMDQWSCRERRIVALGILLGLLLILVFALLLPYAARYSHYLTAIDEQHFRLERLLAMAAQVPALEAEIATLREQVRSQGHLLDQATPSLAAADIQARVAQLVSTHGGNIRSIQVGRPLEEQGFTRVLVSVRMTSTSEELANLFTDIESSRPLFFLDNIQIRLSRQRGRGATQRETGELELEFDLYAYMSGAGQ